MPLKKFIFLFEGFPKGRRKKTNTLRSGWPKASSPPPPLLAGSFLWFFWSNIIMYVFGNRHSTRKRQFSCNFYWNLQEFYKKKAIFMSLLLESQIPPFIAAALWMIICKRPAPHFDNYEKSMRMHIWDPSKWDKRCFECHKKQMSMKKDQHF